MIDSSLKQELISKGFEGEFIIPSYESFCLSNLPATIASFFGTRMRTPTLPAHYISERIPSIRPRNVLLMVLDGFGYNAWLQMISDGCFFQRATDCGVMFPVTTVFPSATAAALTSLSTGLTPQEHGLPEWYVYVRELDMIIATLPFSPMGTPGLDVLLGRMDPRSLFSGKTVFSYLRESGIESVTIVPSAGADSAYSHLALKGSNIVPYQSLTDYAVLIRKRLQTLTRRTLICAYCDAIDSLAHKYGPNTDEWQAEVATLSHVLKKEFLEKVDRDTANKTLLIVTADHGQVNVSPNETTYLNGFRKVVRNFARSRRAKAILPSWSARDVALQIREDRLEETRSELSDLLEGKAVVLHTKDAVKLGLFGLNSASARFMQRAGNMVILPRRNQTIWYKHPQGKKFQFLGAHGGLSEEEILVPLAISRLSDLTNT